MSLIKRSYKYRMYPNKTQEELLAKTFGCVRVIWNACVDSFNSYDKETNPNPKFPTKSDLVIEKPWLNEVSSATLQQKQRDFIEFSRQYFNNNRKEKFGRPNYKNKHDNQSFRLPFPKFKIADNKIRIEKIGWVKIVIDREIPDNARFISCTVSKNRAGQYFVSVLVETEQCHKQKTSKTVGVDLGIKTLATLSDGMTVENLPSCGELSLIYMHLTSVNNALSAIGGQQLTKDYHLSSSEYDPENFWIVLFNNGRVFKRPKRLGCRVRFVRKIE